MADIPVEWVEEIPEILHASPYDGVAERVRETGKVAKITSSKDSLHTLAGRLRNRYKDLKVKSRTTEDGYYVFIYK